MYVYLNKLFKLFILSKEIIMIIKTHIKFILNMYNFSKFFFYYYYYIYIYIQRERERERERERDYLCLGTKKYNTKTYEPKIQL